MSKSKERLRIIKRRNYLMRVKQVQEAYQEFKNAHPGVTEKYIYETAIFPHFFISRPTLWVYLNMNARRELSILDVDGTSCIAAFLLVAALFLGACATPAKLQDIAIATYPVRDSVALRYDTIPFELELAPYEITVHDTVPCPPGLTDTMQVYTTRTIIRPGRTIEVQIPVVDSTIYRRYTAVEAQLNEALKVCESKVKEADKWKDKAQARSKWMYWFLIACLLLIGQNIFKYIRK